MNASHEGLYFNGVLPIKLGKVDNFPSEMILAQLNDANESLLKAHHALNEATDLDEHDEIVQELHRQDAKLNLILDLISELIRKQDGFPESRELSLTPTYLECSLQKGQDPAVEINDHVKIELFVSIATPKPLIIYGVVSEKDDASALIRINFSSLNQTTRDWLEKFIFRQHRLAVAQLKSSQ